MAKQTVDQWVQEALADDTKDGPCTSIAMVHIVAGQREQEIFTQKIGTTAWDPKVLADIFRTKAENHAAELPGAQTFNLMAFYANRGECQARKPFMITGGNQSVDAAQLLTEAPTPQGLVQQVMRHGEAYASIALKHTAVMVEQSASMVHRLATMNEKLMQQQNEQFDMIRQLLVQRDQRENDRSMDRMKFERSTKERAQLMKVAPALLNTLTGREVFPQSTADTALIEAMAEKIGDLPEEDLSTIASKLPAELWGPLAKRFTQVLQERNREAIVRREAGNGADPELDFQ